MIKQIARKDLSYSYGCNSYTILYKGKPIGGAASMEKRRRIANLNYYKQQAEITIEQMLGGRISKMFQDAIIKIDQEEE